MAKGEKDKAFCRRLAVFNLIKKKTAGLTPEAVFGWIISDKSLDILDNTKELNAARKIVGLGLERARRVVLAMQEIAAQAKASELRNILCLSRMFRRACRITEGLPSRRRAVSSTAEATPTLTKRERSEDSAEQGLPLAKEPRL